MTRWFTVAGPCRADIHYMLPSRVRLPDIVHLIDQQNYFVLHAPRQTGKTTVMIDLARDLTAGGRYAAVMLSLGVGAPSSDNPGMAENAVLGAWRDATAFYLPTELQPPP